MVKTINEVFLEYYETRIPLDSFLWKNTGSDPKFKSLWIVAKIIFVLCHGQATGESGYSDNKMLHVENLNMESPIAQRLICDYMKQTKKYEPHSFSISKS